MTFLRVIGLFLIFSFLSNGQVVSQITPPKNRLKVNLNKEEDHFVQFFFNSQFWLRYSQTNPGTLNEGEPKDYITDISIRRLRIGSIGKVTDRIGFIAVLGANNINYNNAYGNALEILDLSADYMITKHFSIGIGKTSWNGLSRYSSPPSTFSILGLDIPVFALPTVNATDYLGRKLSIYGKGQIGKFDYRITASKPVPIENQTGQTPTIGEFSTYAPEVPAFRTSGYFKYQFLDKESQLHPFMAGTYLGTKRILNLGAGFDYHPNAMWHLDDLGHEQRTDMILWAADLFYDVPLNKLSALTFYGAFYHYDFGPGYIRCLGINNPYSDYDASHGCFNGPGNAYPMVGTGNIVFSQVGYLFPQRLLGAERNWRCQLTGGMQYADYQRLDDPVWQYSVAMNWMFGDFTKVTLGYDQRPIFDFAGVDRTLLKATASRSAVILQLQFAIK